MLLSGMGRMPGTCLGFFKVTTPVRAKKQLAKIIKTHNPLGLRDHDAKSAVQLAFSAHGLQQMGLDVSLANGFDRAFCEGMTTEFRQRVLGDLETNSPGNWLWSDSGADVVIWTYTQTGSDAEQLLADILKCDRETGMKQVYSLSTDRLPGTREHFGFRDGISNPGLPRSGQTDPDDDGSGDFLFGFKDATGETAKGPVINHQQVGKFGSYLVLRQISQDVPAFWKQWLKAADGDSDKAIWLASKAVGRWPNGMPVESTDPEPMPRLDESKVRPMNFHGDEKGMKCPFGSHIRRSNPQDDPGGLAKLPRHRILRRGRVYGPLCDPKAYPEGLWMEPNHIDPDSSADRGIIFACLNTDIGRQFEFVQQTWINNPKFKGLHKEIDPISGGTPKGMKADVFTIPSKPFRHRVKSVQPHVKVMGGGYFFLPGKPAIDCIFRS